MMTKDESSPFPPRQAKSLGFPWVQVLFVAGVLAGFTTLLGLAWWGSSLAADVSSLVAQKDELQRSKRDLTNEIEALQSKAERTAERLAGLERQAEALEEKRNSARATVEDLEAHMAERGLSTPEVRQYFAELRRTLEKDDDPDEPSEKPHGTMLLIPLERLQEIREKRPATAKFLDEVVRGTRAARDWAWADLQRAQTSPNWTAEEQMRAIAMVKRTAVELLVNAKRDSKEFVDAHNLRGQARVLEARHLKGAEQITAYGQALADLEIAMRGTQFTRPHQDALLAASALMQLGVPRFQAKSDVVDYACSDDFVRGDKYRATNCAPVVMEVALELHDAGKEARARSLACQAQSMTFPEVATDRAAAVLAKQRRGEACRGKW